MIQEGSLLTYLQNVNIVSFPCDSGCKSPYLLANRFYRLTLLGFEKGAPLPICKTSLQSHSTGIRKGSLLCHMKYETTTGRFVTNDHLFNNFIIVCFHSITKTLKLIMISCERCDNDNNISDLHFCNKCKNVLSCISTEDLF